MEHVVLLCGRGAGAGMCLRVVVVWGATNGGNKLSLRIIIIVMMAAVVNWPILSGRTSAFFPVLFQHFSPLVPLQWNHHSLFLSEQHEKRIIIHRFLCVPL